MTTPIPMDDNEIASALTMAIVREMGVDGAFYVEGFLDGLTCFSLHPEWSAKVLAAMIRYAESTGGTSYIPERFENYLKAVTV